MRLHPFAVALLTLVGVAAPLMAENNDARRELGFPHAGIALSIPEGYQPRRVSEPFDVMRYVLERDGTTQVAVSLSAFPVSEDVTAEEFAEAKLSELRNLVAMRQFELIKTAEMPVANVTGHALRMNYTFGGIETTAAQVYFVREVNDRPVHICYLLTVEERGEQNRLLSELGELVRTIRFLSPRHPGDIETPELGEPVRSSNLGFSVRPPEGWFGDTSLYGVNMGQTDYLLGGVMVPTVRVMVGRPDADVTAERLASRHLASLRETVKSRNVKVEVLSEGEAELAGRKGWQFVVRQYAELPEESPDNDSSVVIAQRTIVVEDEQLPPVAARAAEAIANRIGPLRSYSIACVYRGENQDRAVEILEHIAEGFSLLTDETDDEAEPAEEPDADEAQPADENG